MSTRYYFDTSIWIDFFENRNEPNLAKSDFVGELIKKITAEDSLIIYSDAVIDELIEQGYNNEIGYLFQPLNKILLFVESDKKQFGKAKDLANKRNIPIFDAFHALIARDNKAILITRDNHFKKLLDIVKCKKPEELI